VLISHLGKRKEESVPAIQTSLYLQEWQLFRQQLHEAEVIFTHAEKEYNRNKHFTKNRVISEAEFDKFQYDFDKAQTNLQGVIEGQLSNWQSLKAKYKREIKLLQEELNLLEKQKERFVIKAPVKGSIQNFKGFYEGSFVFANQPLLEISPASAQIVEVYVHPKDIGFIQPGTKTKYQVTAYNYQQWGLASGEVLEVSKDVLLVEGNPVFKVRCSLDQSFLELKNGYKGNLKKGMTLSSRFIITERSLFDLIYDTVDDWLNPYTGTIQS
jgi:membrane fusion protein, peptide pheromone/bacteriocin exporter